MTPQVTISPEIHRRTPNFPAPDCWGAEKRSIRQKHSSGTPDDALAQAQLSAHLQHGETHVDAVKVGDDVEEKQKRHQPQHQSGDYGGFHAVGSSFQKGVPVSCNTCSVKTFRRYRSVV